MDSLLKKVKKQTIKDAFILTGICSVILVWLLILSIFLFVIQRKSNNQNLNDFEDYREEIIEGSTDMAGQQMVLNITSVGDCFYEGGTSGFYYYFMPLSENTDENQTYMRIRVSEELHQKMEMIREQTANGATDKSEETLSCRVKGTITYMENWEYRFIEHSYMMKEEQNSEQSENILDQMTDIAFDIESEMIGVGLTEGTDVNTNVIIVPIISVVMLFIVMIIWIVALWGLPYGSLKKIYRSFNEDSLIELEWDFRNADEIAKGMYIGEKYIYGYVNAFFHCFRLIPLKNIEMVGSISKFKVRRGGVFSIRNGLLVWQKDGQKTGYGYYRNEETVTKAIDKIISIEPEIKVKKRKNNNIME